MAEPEPKKAEFIESFTAGQWYGWKLYTPIVWLWGFNESTRIQQSHGEHKPEKDGFQKFISPILSYIQKFAEFNGKSIFLNPNDGKDITRKLEPRPTQETESTETYNRPSARSLWQTHKCVGSGLCCPDKFLRLPNWEKPEPKRRNYRYSANNA